MAGLLCRCSTSAVALSAATAKTVFQISAPSNHRLVVTRLHVAFDGSSNTAVPARVLVCRQTTAGTPSFSAPLARKVAEGLDETPQATVNQDFSAEPTTGDAMTDRYVPTYNGEADLVRPGEPIDVAGGSRLGVVVTAPAGVNCRVNVDWDE